ncbi:hypothetical protein [Bacillus sp. FJAT-45350]|uniref:hypothetical protein n=1 Tax=Bacillus sp. FJAT-45350 TaxID=2011014 RepID=UPI000BB9AA0B|nr:hypothetical protein [Bacillus sp. FJAT-45350]
MANGNEFYVLNSDKALANRLHKHVIHMRSTALACTLDKEYYRADQYESEAHKAIRELKDLEAKRVHHERKVRQLERQAKEIAKDGFTVTYVIEGSTVL